MPKRNEKGRFTRVYYPKARRVVLREQDYYAVPGRHGMAWEHMGEGLVERAPYDPEEIARIRQAGGIPRLVDHVLPFLNGERRRKVIENIQSISHAKQRAMMGNDPAHRARRLSKAERRVKRKENELKKLKALLKA